MRYFPIFLDINGRRCVVLGGGRVAERKARGLLKAGADVIVISPWATTRLKALAKQKRLTHVKRGYKRGDLKGAVLVISATDEKRVNEAVVKEAKRSNIPVNAVDSPALCSFIAPSVVDRGPLLIAISTSGECPFLSKTLRLAIEAAIGPEYAAFTELLGAVREALLKAGANSKKERVIKRLMDSPMLNWIKQKKTREIDALLEDVAGFGLKDLGVTVKTAYLASASK